MSKNVNLRGFVNPGRWLAPLFVVFIWSTPFFAYAQATGSPYSTAPGSWYVIYAGQSFCIASDPRVPQLPHPIVAPSVEAVAYEYVSYANASRACSDAANPPPCTVIASVGESNESGYFSIYSKWVPITAVSCGPDAGVSPFRLGTNFYKADPDPTYVTPTCVSGPNSAYCEKIDKQCPPGFSITNCTQPVAPKNFGPTHSCAAKPSAGNPVDIGTGNKYQVEQDYAANGASPIALSRIYNGSTVAQTGVFGANWRSGYEQSIKLYEMGNKTTAAVFRLDGRIFYFEYANGAFSSTGDITDKLLPVVDVAGQTTGFKFQSATTDEVEDYNSFGRLQAITNRAGVKQILTYDAQSVMVAVTDSFGRKMQFSGINPIRTMTDPSGGVTSYQYSFDKLTTVTYPDGKVRQYLYENPTLLQALTGIIDENGKRFATWTYDAQGRVRSSEHAGGTEKVTFAYDATGTQVTDAIGSTRRYNFETVLGLVRNTGQSQPGGSGCAAAANLITYDANGNIASLKDFNDNLTTYNYDLQRNLETSRIEAAGTASARTISMEWLVNYRLPARIVAPNLLVTFNYDPSGNLLTKTEQPTTDASGSAGFNAVPTGSPRSWRYTYNALGQVVTATGPRTDVSEVTTYGYDVAGNLATLTNPAGQLTKFTSYDANGRLLSMTDMNGALTTMTYSPRGWLLSNTTQIAGTTNTESTTYTYDGVGQMITAKFRDGSVINYTYDDAHRLTAVADSARNKITYTLDNLGNHVKETAVDPTGVLARSTARVYDALNRLQQVTGSVQ